MSAVQPRISVIIPAFNVERYLPEAIDSVCTQTLAPTEILVIDDGSTDGTAAVVRQFKNEVALIVQENQGRAGLWRIHRLPGCGRSMEPEQAGITVQNADPTV